MEDGTEEVSGQKNKEPRGRRARSVGVHVRAVAGPPPKGRQCPEWTADSQALSSNSLTIPSLSWTLCLCDEPPLSSVWTLLPPFRHRLGITISAMLVLSFSPVSFVL